MLPACLLPTHHGAACLHSKAQHTARRTHYTAATCMPVPTHVLTHNAPPGRAALAVRRGALDAWHWRYRQACYPNPAAGHMPCGLSSVKGILWGCRNAAQSCCCCRRRATAASASAAQQRVAPAYAGTPSTVLTVSSMSYVVCSVACSWSLALPSASGLPSLAISRYESSFW